jgi:hypothetical protein
MNKLVNNYQKLLLNVDASKLPDENSFYFEDLPNSNLKLGISSDNLPVLMIPAIDEYETEEINRYSGLNVSLYRRCKLIDSEVYSSTFHLIKCLDDEAKIIKTFLDFFEDLFSEPKGQEIDSVLERLEFLSKLLGLRKSKSKKSAMGLWSELFLINSYSLVSEFISAWHNQVKEKLDFEFSDMAIEVKSFSTDQRVHFFSQHQLSNLSYEDLFIMSVQLKEIDETLSIRDLYLQILSKISGRETKDKFNKVFFEYAGDTDLDDYRFSLSIANNTVKFLNASDIPSIIDEAIPTEVSGLRYKSDCSKVDPIEFNKISLLI